MASKGKVETSESTCTCFSTKKKLERVSSKKEEVVDLIRQLIKSATMDTVDLSQKKWKNIWKNSNLKRPLLP